MIAASSLRPFVLADERITKWTSPHATQFRQDLGAFISPAASSRLFHIISEGMDVRTRKNYGAGLLRFTQFCDELGIPEAMRMPAPEALVAAFIARHAGVVRHDTIGSWLSGLAVWHAINGAKWPGGSILTYVKKGAKKVEPPPLAKRPPVTLEHMHALFTGLDLSNTFDAAVFAVACCAFWGCRRLGELIVPSRHGFDGEKHVAAGVDVGVRTLPSDVRYAVFHIPWTKTTKREGANIILTANPDPTDPVTALLHHRVMNRALPSGAPMFAFETNGESAGWAPMTRDWFLNRCNGVWTMAGLGVLTGHCFRIGGATELLLRGTHPDIVATQGGWKSKAFLEYWRKIESILPLFISKSFDQSRIQLLSNTMDEFRRRNAAPS
ncbi:uncharacterized protein TRAVEDRAFT_54675 [Trametes versicolor FP-101664 SS1]|uniref:DNA breaking-rejoining enzyme n=1 Tax=Trametes versicolor (strain FP-101664) TaxID=717944 RepID=R7S8L7_TRAVS|nr:uncharacterized protein TRAVEDRAFT_54675 [Trametes versicolor FP-101664 SS1]EIW51304.1 hypothetical protein TRAVEDRAFT_54675 [Trametes versicolor FP-101664 SS1]